MSENVIFAPWFSAVPGNDTDQDTIADDTDNCPAAPNTDQNDLDSDGLGDVCDADADGDGFVAESEGGNDCDDLNGSINPNAGEIPGDNIDQDCDGSDSVDIQPDNYYIDPANGTDDVPTGIGSGAQAWKTLHYAILMLNAGSPGAYTLELNDGVYDLNSEGDTPLILNQSVAINGNGSILDGSGDHGASQNPWTSGLILGPGAENVSINNLKIEGFETGIHVTSDGGCLTLTDVFITWLRYRLETGGQPSGYCGHVQQFDYFKLQDGHACDRWQFQQPYLEW